MVRQLLSSEVGLWSSGTVHSYVSIVPGATESSRFMSAEVPSGYRAPVGRGAQSHTSIRSVGLSAGRQHQVSGPLTLGALAVVQPMRVDAVRSGCCVLQVDDHRVSLLCHQHRPQVAQPLWFHHFCPVGGVTVLLVHGLLVGWADALGSFH